MPITTPNSTPSKDLDLHDHLVKNPIATFFVRAAGDSMSPHIHTGDLLADGVPIRVISLRGINTAFTGKFGGGVGVRKIPRFLNAKGVKSLISNDLMARILEPVEFNPLHGGRSAFGYEATLLPEICEVILNANRAGILVVDRSQEAVNGSVVIAAVEGELTVKRLLRKNGRVLLAPENNDYPVIDITEQEDTVLWGVVTYAVHKVRPDAGERV